MILDKFNKGMVVFAISFTILFIVSMSSCSYKKGAYWNAEVLEKLQGEDHPDCPVCGECYASDAHLDAHCATNFEGIKTGSHDFFLEGEDKITSSKLATKCLTCGIYFTYPDYGEHIKTCCP